MSWLSSISFWAMTIGVVPFWWAAKRLAVHVDSATIWDASDLLFGLYGAVGWFVFFSLNPLVSSQVDTDIHVLRIFAAGIYSYSFVFWFASIFIEVKTDVAVPESMAPIETRFYEQFSWIPFWRRFMEVENK